MTPVEPAGRYGANLGYIKVDLDGGKPVVEEARMIPVVGQNPAKFDKKIERFIAPYTHIVDSINARRIAVCDVSMRNTKQYATSVLLSNFTADAVQQYAVSVADSISLPGGVDLTVVNSGGIRLPMDKGAITEGKMVPCRVRRLPRC